MAEPRPALPDEISDEKRSARRQRLENTLHHIKHKLLVMSGKGGVGKSTVAAYLALGLAAEGHAVGLMDVDLHGPSIPRLLGIHQNAGVAEAAGLIAPIQYRKDLEVISIEVLMGDHEESVIWRGPMKIKAIKQMLADVLWGNLDFLVIDSPPGTGDEPLCVAQTVVGARAVIVTTPQELALADVRKSIDFCRRVKMPILGVVENLSGLICPECGHAFDPYGRGGGRATAERYDLDLLGELPMDLRLVQAGDQGRPLDLSRDEKGAGPAYRALVQSVLRRTVAFEKLWADHFG